MAVFQFEAKIPSLSDTFIIFVMVEITPGRICFNREVGIGSVSHDLVATPFIILFTSSSETSLNCLSTSLGLVIYRLSWIIFWIIFKRISYLLDLMYEEISEVVC